MITVFGSANIDLICSVERLPGPGETILGSSFRKAPGGKGANQALAAQRAGGEVRLAGRIGADHHAAEATALLREAGIDLSFLNVSASPTGTAHITVSADGENTIVVVPGANGEVTVADADQALDSMGKGDHLVVQLEIPEEAVQTALLMARVNGVTSILNLSPITASIGKLGKLADIIVTNETEFDLYTGTELSGSRRTDEMLKMSSRTGQTIIVTLGAKGVVAARGGELYHAGGLKVVPLDTVGAGDTLCGYLAAGLDQGLEFGVALKQAAVAGSLACLKSGAQPSIPFIGDVAKSL